MRLGEPLKPFENFLKGVMIFVAIVNLVVIILLWRGILKRPGPRHPAQAFPTPSSMNFFRNS
ncbi:MAG: hypothetical protein WCD79_15165 [Chthoniobacteraceae bacterium]